MILNTQIQDLRGSIHLIRIIVMKEMIGMKGEHLVESKGNLVKEYIVTQALLDEHKLPLTKFLSYLKGELDMHDKYFYISQEVHNFNGPISISNKKHSINLLNKDSQLNVIEITTAYEKY